MKQIKYLICGIALLFVIPVLTAPRMICAQELDRAVALVRLHKTANISRNEYRKRKLLLEEQINQSLNTEQQMQLLDALVNAELMRQDAEKINIRVTDEEVAQNIDQQRQLISKQNGRLISEAQFRQIIENQTNLTWGDYQAQVKNRLIQEKYIFKAKREIFAAITEPTNSSVETFYEENATQFTNPAIVHIEFLLIRTDNISDEVRQQRKSKATALLSQTTKSVSAFEKAKKDSLDDPLVTSGEVLLLRGNKQQGELYGEAFVADLFALQKNTFATRVLESNVGYHIVRIVDKRAPKVLLLDDPVLPGQSITVRNQVRNRLLLEKQQETLQLAIKEVVAELRDRADITVYTDRL